VHGEVEREVRVTVVDSTQTVVPFNIRGSTLSNHVSFAYKVRVVTYLLVHLCIESKHVMR